MSAPLRYECRICWQVYDPAIGDQVAQIPPDTEFAALPEDWLCPRCDAPKLQFILIDPETGDA
ncbi:MAG: rubredoxin [Acidiphilium sp.]|nr:rubredoxin [Acidiphilium sp.]MDD4935100.1 rubredoxin [Acidiphilium sp.]